MSDVTKEDTKEEEGEEIEVKVIQSNKTSQVKRIKVRVTMDKQSNNNHKGNKPFEHIGTELYSIPPYHSMFDKHCTSYFRKRTVRKVLADNMLVDLDSGMVFDRKRADHRLFCIEKMIKEVVDKKEREKKEREMAILDEKKVREHYLSYKRKLKRVSDLKNTLYKKNSGNEKLIK